MGLTKHTEHKSIITDSPELKSLLARSFQNYTNIIALQYIAAWARFYASALAWAGTEDPHLPRRI